MKLISFAFFFIFNTFAASISFIGACDEEPVFNHEISNASGYSVGELTIETLDLFSVSYIGNVWGMNSIFDTPIGNDALEVISDTEMLAYGWCYSVNGFESSLFPGEFVVEDGDEILWWFGYAHYKDGEWISQCEPAYLIRPVQICYEQ